MLIICKPLRFNRLNNYTKIKLTITTTKENDNMKTKMIMGISIAAALGASAIGGTLMYKATPVNHTVYAKSVSSVKNVEKENVTLYIPNLNLINKESSTPVIHDGKKYTPVTFTNTGKLIPVSDLFTQSITANVENSTSLGDAVIKKCDTPPNIATSKGDVFNAPCTKVEVKLPIGTKLKVLWTGKSLVKWNPNPHDLKLANVVAVDYNGKLAFISDDYLNMDNVAKGKEAMQLVSKNELKTAHYIGTSKAVTGFGPSIDPLTHKPIPVNMTVPVNGRNYNLNVKGKTVNVIYYGGNVMFNLKPNEMMGETFGPAMVGGEKYAKVEYDGIIGYIYYGNLSNAPKSVYGE